MLVSLVLPDSGSQAAIAWFSSHPHDIALSDFVWGEFVATVGREVRSKKLSAEDGKSVAERTRQRFARMTWLATTPEDVRVATAMVAQFHLGLRLPDAIHLAIARRHGATIITADEKQGGAAAALGIGYVDPIRPSKEPV